MWEGMDEPLPDGNWEVVGAVPAPLPARAQPGAPRADASTSWREIREQFVAAARAGRRGRLRPARAALRARLPALVVPLPADQPAHRRATAGRSRAGCASRSRSSTRCGRCGRSDKPMTRADLGHRLVRRRHRRRRRRRDRPRVRRRRGRRHRRLDRAGRRRGAPGVRRGLPDPVRRPDPQRGRASRPSPSGAISSYDDVNSILLAGRADLCALGRAAPLRPAAGRCTRPTEQGYAGPGATWPLPWRPGARKPQSGRTDGPRPRLDLVRRGATGTAHRRWRP